MRTNGGFRFDRATRGLILAGAALLLTAAGCPGSPAPPEPDLAANIHDLAVDDLAAPDLARGDALAGRFCAGTPVAGTCAQAFFDAVTACWTPSGNCTYSTASYGVYSTCWQSGARRIETGMQGGVIQVRWLQGATTCLAAADDYHNGDRVVTFTAGGRTLVFTARTNEIVCPDGTKATPAAPMYSWGNCAEWNILVNGAPPNCQYPPSCCTFDQACL